MFESKKTATGHAVASARKHATHMYPTPPVNGKNSNVTRGHERTETRTTCEGALKKTRP